MQHFGKAAIRSAKNYTQGYSDVQIKVRDATSNDPWGPTGQQMNEIAKLSWNQQDFIEIIEILDKRLNDKGKNWRHVFKTLAVVDYCLLQGSEDVVRYYKENVYMIKTLREFQYVDEESTDQGANVRQRAKDITNLLLDDSKIRAQRRGRADARDRMRQVEKGSAVPWEEGGGGSSGGGDEGGGSRRGKRNKEEEDLQKAIEESKRSLAQEKQTAEDKDLERALKLSQEDEASRSKLVHDANEKALFDDQSQLPAANASLNPQLTTNPFPMAMNTGLQPHFLQPQFTQMQPQFTSYNPYQQQMQEVAQAEYLRQQEGFQQQQQAAFQAQQQQQQEEWMRQQMMQQQQQQQLQFQQQQSLFPQTQSLMAQPTGFGNNNPFARTTSSPSPVTSQNTQPMFNIQGTYDSGNHQQMQDLSTPSSAFRSPSPNTQGQANRPVHVKTKQNENQQLASLFADRDGGQDTFGNVGMTRYGHTDAGKIVVQQTTMGNNPFARQQQQQQMNDQPFFSI